MPMRRRPAAGGPRPLPQPSAASASAVEGSGVAPSYSGAKPRQRSCLRSASRAARLSSGMENATSDHIPSHGWLAAPKEKMRHAVVQDRRRPRAQPGKGATAGLGRDQQPVAGQPAEAIGYMTGQTLILDGGGMSPFPPPVLLRKRVSNVPQDQPSVPRRPRRQPAAPSAPAAGARRFRRGPDLGGGPEGGGG